MSEIGFAFARGQAASEGRSNARLKTRTSVECACSRISEWITLRVIHGISFGSPKASQTFNCAPAILPSEVNVMSRGCTNFQPCRGNAFLRVVNDLVTEEFITRKIKRFLILTQWNRLDIVCNFLLIRSCNIMHMHLRWHRCAFTLNEHAY